MYYDVETDRYKCTSPPQDEVTLRPLSFCFEVTNSCHFDCDFCLISGHLPPPTTSHSREIIDGLTSAGPVRIGFSGGEPLLVPAIYELGMQAKAAGAITLLRTTGTWPIDIKRVQQAFDWVDMSVDAVDEAMYTRMRGRPGLTVLLRQTEALLAAGIRVRFNCLLSSVNQSHLLPVMDLAKGVGVRYVRYSPFIARGKAASSGIRQKHGLAAGELDNVYALIRSYAAAVGIAVSVVTTVKNRAIFIVKPNGDVFFPLDAGLMTLGNVVGRDLVSMFPVELLRRHCGAYWAHNCSTSP